MARLPGPSLTPPLQPALPCPDLWGSAGIGRANDAFDPASLDPYLSGYDSGELPVTQLAACVWWLEGIWLGCWAVKLTLPARMHASLLLLIASPFPCSHLHLSFLPSSPAADLDWGDFFFNLISMCIVYAYFSEAAVAGESQAAIVVSMAIAAIDILLLALRWLW